MKISARTKAVACAAALALAPMGAAAQEKGEKPADRDTSRIESVDELFSARSLMRPIRITAADLAATGTPVFRLSRKRNEARAVGLSGAAFAPVSPLDDLLGDPTGQQQDIRDRARNYVKQQIVKEILSRSAVGRGLSLFIDTGEQTLRDAGTRSRLLPFISPRVDAGEGKIELQLTWKF
jgi:hypothetical protein